MCCIVLKPKFSNIAIPVYWRQSKVCRAKILTYQIKLQRLCFTKAEI